MYRGEIKTRHKVLVAYASKMGGTAGIAEVVGEQLRDCGHQVDIRDVEDVSTLFDYGVVVLGSAIYARSWRKDAVRFLQHHQGELRQLPVFLFQSGPIGPDRHDEQAAPLKVARLLRKIGAGEPRTFAGRLGPDSATGIVAKWLTRGQPSGDFRDWPAIRQWALEIHEALQDAALTP